MTFSKAEAATATGLRGARITALVCSLTTALYAIAQVDPSPLVVLFTSAGPLIAVIMWMQRDARRTGVGSVHDFGFFVWLAWPVVIPWYAWKTRGRSGWRLMVGLFVLIGSAHLTWLFTSWLNESVALAAGR
jgi:hypothetical protein